MAAAAAITGHLTDVRKWEFADEPALVGGGRRS
jgi:hypothetical protein